jgi:hypothetical protein
MDRASALKRSPPNGSTLRSEIERCEKEIQSVENALRSGHPDVAGLCLALFDWSAELRILQNEQRRQCDPAASGIVR